MADVIVTLRLRPTEAKAIEELLLRGRFCSRSDLLREALEALLLKERLSKDAFHQIRRERPRPRRRVSKLAQAAELAGRPSQAAELA